MTRFAKRLVVDTAVLCGLLLVCGCTSKPTQSAEGGGQSSTGNSSASRQTSATGSATAGPASGDGASQTTSNSSIDRYLATKPSASHPSPLVGQGATFESFGKQYAIDPRFIVAITAAETSYATAKCHSTPVVNTHNAWNWFCCYSNDSCGSDSCVNSTFDTWGSGIETLSKFMRKNYVNKGYTSVTLIASKYCTSGCENWIPNVTSSLKEMNGDPNNLTLSTGP